MMTSTTNNIHPLQPLKTLLGSTTVDEGFDVILHCPKHGTYKGKKTVFLGKSRMSRCLVCREEQRQEKSAREAQKIRAAREQRITTLLGQSGIPERFQCRTFANYRVLHPAQERVFTIAKRYAEQFEERLSFGGGLVLAGKPGTGKTHLAAAIGNSVIQMGRCVLFISVIAALRTVKTCYRTSSEKSEQQAIHTLIAPDLLILDEVGVQFGSETEKLILFEILNGRYEAMLPTIVISNLTEQELIFYLGSRVVDRLCEGGGLTLCFDWESYRPHVHQDPALPKRVVKPVEWSSSC